MGLGLLGALAGAGAAFQGVADRRIDQYQNIELEKLRAEAEDQMLARKEESAKRLGIFEEGLAINREKRGLENDRIERQNRLMDETDPEVIKRQAEAETTRQGLLDKYKYGNVGAEAAYRRKLAEATRFGSPDHTDYEGRRLKHELTKAQIEKLRGGEEDGELKLVGKPWEVAVNEKGDVHQFQMTKDGTPVDLTELALEQRKAIEIMRAQEVENKLGGGKSEMPSREQLISELNKELPTHDVESWAADKSDEEIFNQLNSLAKERQQAKEESQRKGVKEGMKKAKKTEEEEKQFNSRAKAIRNQSKGSKYFSTRDQ